MSSNKKKCLEILKENDNDFFANGYRIYKYKESDSLERIFENGIKVEELERII